MHSKIVTIYRATPASEEPIFGSALHKAADKNARDDDEKFHLCAVLMAHEVRDYARMANRQISITPEAVAGTQTFINAYEQAKQSGFDPHAHINYHLATRKSINQLREGEEPDDSLHLQILYELDSAHLGARMRQVNATFSDPHWRII